MTDSAADYMDMEKSGAGGRKAATRKATAAMDGEKKMSPEFIEKLFALNSLRYAVPSNLTIVGARSNKISPPDVQLYDTKSGAQEMTVRLATSTDFVYGRNCYISMRVLATPAASSNVGFRNGTAMNLFSRFVIESEAGQEIERIESLNFYCRQVLPWRVPADYLATGLAMAGQYTSGQTADGFTYGTNGGGRPAPGGTAPASAAADNYDCSVPDGLQVIIPLWWFSGVFARETLIPSTLISGARLRFTLAPALQAFESLLAVPVVVALDGYQIIDPHIVLDSMTLAPVIQRNLLELSANTGGLVYPYETAYNQNGTPGTATNFDLMINKAVSRCTNVVWSTRASNTPVNTAHDSLGTAQCNLRSLDYRLGSSYFPSRVILVPGTTSSPVKQGAELYQNSLQSFSRMSMAEATPSITKAKFLTTGQQPDATAANNDNSGYSVHCQSFRTNNTMEWSGLSLSASRSLSIRPQWITTGAGQEMTAFIHYIKVSRCAPDRIYLIE
jgi:hypothetical protein